MRGKGMSSSRQIQKEKTERIISRIIKRRDITIDTSKDTVTPVKSQGVNILEIYYRLSEIRVYVRVNSPEFAVYGELERKGLAYQKEDTDPYSTEGKFGFFIEESNVESALSMLLAKNTLIETKNESKIYLGITDTEWMNFIRNKQELGLLGNKINFWTPSTIEFKALKPGELFLFKRHNRKAKGENGEIVGGGYFVAFEKMSISDAWNHFRYGNGSETMQEMQEVIQSYRDRNDINAGGEIGCIILERPFFLSREKWIDSPSDWGKSIVRGKTYSCDSEVGINLLSLIANNDEQIDSVQVIEDEIKANNLHGEEKKAFIKVRVNQGVFRKKLLDKYDGCCLCKVENPNFLVASHIKPWVYSKPNEKLDDNNGFLLCPNHDALFDGGFISFKDDGSILISDEVSEIDRIFMNIKSDMHIELTAKNREYLKWHRDHIYRK